LVVLISDISKKISALVSAPFTRMPSRFSLSDGVCKILFFRQKQSTNLLLFERPVTLIEYELNIP
jgi:hypothetical protein